MKNRNYETILKESRIAYTKGFVQGILEMTREADLPEDRKEEAEDLAAGEFTDKKVRLVRDEHQKGLYGDLFEALKLETRAGRLIAKDRDKISLQGAQSLNIDKRLWELGRYLAINTEASAYFEFMNKDPLLYNAKEDIEFGAILQFARENGLSDYDVWM